MSQSFPARWLFNSDHNHCILAGRAADQQTDASVPYHKMLAKSECNEIRGKTQVRPILFYRPSILACVIVALALLQPNNILIPPVRAVAPDMQEFDEAPKVIEAGD